MANEKVNKVVLGNETLIDLTGDTVNANNLLSGATAHDSRGEQIQGAVSVPEELNDLNDVDNNSPQEGDVLVSDENGVYQNKPINKVTSFAVDLTGWTSDTTSQSGTTLYKKQISLTNVYVASPSVDIGAGTGYVLPTSAEQEAYNLLQYVTVDDTVPCLYLYASDIPTTAFYINVTGVD